VLNLSMEKNTPYKLERLSLPHELDQEVYESEQIYRHGLKAGKARPQDFYREVTNDIVMLYKDQSSGTRPGKMLCMGARNNWEKICFQRYLDENLSDKITVYSNDIAPASHTDFVFDFQDPPANMLSAWDVVYCNAIDHAQSATDTFYKWVDMIKPTGMLVVGFCMSQGVPNNTDICIFDEESLEVFFKKFKS